MLKRIVTICLLLGFVQVSAQDETHVGGIELEVEAKDSIQSIEGMMDDAIDSLSIIPFFMEYASWNNTKVHPYKVDLTKMTDTIPLMLEDLPCDYAHSVCGEINSDFGYRRKRFHYGIDVDLEVGDPVLASFEGVVRIA